MHKDVAIRSPQHRVETERHVQRIDPVTQDLISARVERGGEGEVVASSTHTNRHDSREGIRLQALASLQGCDGMRTRIDDDKARTAAKRGGQQIVLRPQQDNWQLARVQPAARQVGERMAIRRKNKGRRISQALRQPRWIRARYGHPPASVKGMNGRDL